MTFHRALVDLFSSDWILQIFGKKGRAAAAVAAACTRVQSFCIRIEDGWMRARFEIAIEAYVTLIFQNLLACRNMEVSF